MSAPGKFPTHLCIDLLVWADTVSYLILIAGQFDLINMVQRFGVILLTRLHGFALLLG